MIEYIAADVLAQLESLALVTQRTGIASSEYIRLKVNGKTKSLTMTLSSETRAEHRIKPHKADGSDEWCFYVERGLFVAFMNIAKSNVTAPVKFVCVPNKLLSISHGRRKADFKSMSEIMGYDSPSIADAIDVTLSKTFRTTVSLAGAFVSDAKDDDHLRCVYLTGTHALAQNKASVIKMPCKSSYVGPVDPKFVSFMRNPEEDKVQSTKRGLVVKFPAGYIFQAKDAACADRFPHEAITRSLKKLALNPVRFAIPSATEWSKVISFFKSVSMTSVDPILEVSGDKGDNKVKFSLKAMSVSFAESVTCEPLKRDIKEELRLMPLLLMSPGKEDVVTVRALPDSNYHVSYGKVQVAISRQVKEKK